MGQIAELQKEVHKTACGKGWWISRRPFTECCMLIVTEISEAVEAFRKTDGGWKDEAGEEFADAVIRIMDVCEYWKINLEEALLKKIEYNKTRPYRHGGKKA